MVPLPFRSAKDLATALRKKKIGALELLDLYVARVDKYNPRLNAIIATDLDGARKRARAADRALARGQVWGPLHGVPMTIKESFDVAGLPTTWGIPELKGNVAAKNSLLVDRMLAAGVVLFGKTNVPLWLADWQSYNAIYGTTNNPWDLSRVPGGSSGGSAAALAAGLTGIETGSDIGASIRNPAHYCGVFGHKPTWTIVPPNGHALAGNVAVADIAVVGPLARSADDLDLALAATAGGDAIDAAGWQLRLPPPRRKQLRDFRVAVMLNDAESEVDLEVQERLAALAAFLGKKRAKVSDRARPAIDSRETHRVYIQLLRSATSARLTADEFRTQAEIARGLAPGDETYYARMVRANTMPHKDWLAANETRHRMRRAWAAFFEEWDVLLCPTAASAAPPHDQQGERWERTIRVNGKNVPTTDQMFWAGFPCMAYLPSTIAPCGFTPSGLPVGVQIVAPQYGDRTAIHFARLLEREYQPFVPPRGYE
ncbi:MAG: amidase [Candidatus Rokubacteria bacterium]|nr:amidase [Candidatus Rokubacteria bacterium]